VGRKIDEILASAPLKIQRLSRLCVRAKWVTSIANIVIYLGPAEGFQAARVVLSRGCEVRAVEPSFEAVAAALKSADALLDASMKVRLTDSMFRTAARLKIVSCATTGSDHIEKAELQRRQIPLQTLCEDQDLLQQLTPAAELTWALILACARRLPAAVDHVRRGEWSREFFPGVMLRGRTMGIVGYGRIGAWVGRYAAAFGMKVVAHDPYRREFPTNVESLELKDLFASSDVASIHVHLTDETRGLISGELLSRLKPGAIFVNTSRGGVVDEASLLTILQSGSLGAAGLDVLQGEPDINDHPLVRYARGHDNLLITPHCGGYAPDAVSAVCARAAQKIAEVLHCTH
jgi:phosphoglycerate dehydrogenase-like enzyme